jgi:hypothetical protein
LSAFVLFSLGSALWPKEQFLCSDSVKLSPEAEETVEHRVPGMIDCNLECRRLGETEIVYIQAYDNSDEKRLVDLLLRHREILQCLLKHSDILTEVFTSLTSGVNNRANVLVLLGSADIS